MNDMTLGGFLLGLSITFFGFAVLGIIGHFVGLWLRWAGKDGAR